MEPWARWAILAGSVVAVVILFVALSPGGASEDGSPTRSAFAPSPSASASPSGPVSPTASPGAEPGVTEIEVTVRGDVVDAPKRPRARVGDEVLIVVRADVSDEVHVHGYDLMADVAPGEPARIRFVADVAGVFEVELEDAGRLLLQLEIVP